MKKPTLQSVLAPKEAQPGPPARSPGTAARAKKVADDGRMSTSLRIEPERLEALKIIALRERDSASTNWYCAALITSSRCITKRRAA